MEIRKLKKKDLIQLSKWGFHDDVRLMHYDFDDFCESAFSYWFASKRVPFYRRIFGVFLDGVLVGYITMKKINWIKKESELGIVFDPNIIGRGIGSEALRNYLDMYFKSFRMKRLYLKVADFNRRACKSYLKVGFTEYKRRLEEFEEQGRSFDILLEHKGEFVMDGDILKTEIIYMEITREIYYNIINS